MTLIFCFISITHDALACDFYFSRPRQNQAMQSAYIAYKNASSSPKNPRKTRQAAQTQRRAYHLESHPKPFVKYLQAAISLIFSQELGCVVDKIYRSVTICFNEFWRCSVFYVKSLFACLTGQTMFGRMHVAVWHLHRFLLRDLPRAFGSVEILRRFSSSSLPPYFVSGRLAAIFSIGLHHNTA
jgi:hypothetical protein